MKKIVFSCFICAALAFSCKTVDPIYTAVSENSSQLVFVRPITIKKVDSVVNDLSVDMTLTVHDGGLIKNPVCNYSLTLPKSYISRAEDIGFEFVAGNSVCVPVETSVLFRNLKGGKCVVRFSVEFDSESFADVIKNPGNARIKISRKGAADLYVGNKDLAARLGDLRVILYKL